MLIALGLGTVQHFLNAEEYYLTNFQKKLHLWSFIQNMVSGSKEMSELFSSLYCYQNLAFISNLVSFFLYF